jgi:ubiquinone/menaquinone biosynthesis C-methylase UbiE
MNQIHSRHEPVTQQQGVRQLYKKRARHYDLSANLYYLTGFREYAYRKQAVELLNLQPGDTVVEIGCGTGLNFAYLQEKVGTDGKIIGVDLTGEMLELAHQRCQANDWHNVKLVEQDAASFRFPPHIDGVISTFALTLVPEYHAVIANAAATLKPGKRMVLLDLQLPDWPRPLVKLGILLTSGFGVNEEIAKRHPWESMAAVFGNMHKSEVYFGAVYLAMSEQSANTRPRMTH